MHSRRSIWGGRTLELVEIEDGKDLLVLLSWIGFNEDERTWELIENIWHDDPDFLTKTLRKMCPSARVRPHFLRQYGNKLSCELSFAWGSSFPYVDDSSLRVIVHASCSA